MTGEAATPSALSGPWAGRSWEAPAEILRFERRAFLVGALAVPALVAGFLIHRPAFFIAYLVAYLFWLSIALGGLAVSMIHHLSRGAWGLPARRVLEAAARTLPGLAVLGVPLLFGLRDLYPWARPEVVAADELLQGKTIYLNVPFFVGRAALYFALWIGFAWLLARLSARQDRAFGDPGLARRMQLLAAPGLGLYCLAATFAAFDWLMSLDPDWVSTIYGVYFVAGHGLAGFAFLILVALFLSRREPLADALGRRHFHDWGKLLLAFVMLWAYFGFSQFLIIWSANLPSEIGFFLTRTRHGWQWVALALVVGHFALPFVLLLSRDLKRRARRLAVVAALVLAMRWVDLYWQAAPALHPQRVWPHYLDLLALAGLGGLWVGLFLRALRRLPLLPLGAPGLEEALGDE
jgi:hypothetical protein